MLKKDLIILVGEMRKENTELNASGLYYKNQLVRYSKKNQNLKSENIELNENIDKLKKKCTNLKEIINNFQKSYAEEVWQTANQVKETIENIENKYSNDLTDRLNELAITRRERGFTISFKDINSITDMKTFKPYEKSITYKAQKNAEYIIIKKETLELRDRMIYEMPIDNAYHILREKFTDTNRKLETKNAQLTNTLRKSKEMNNKLLNEKIKHDRENKNKILKISQNKNQIQNKANLEIADLSEYKNKYSQIVEYQKLVVKIRRICEQERKKKTDYYSGVYNNFYDLIRLPNAEELIKINQLGNSIDNFKKDFIALKHIRNSICHPSIEL